MTFSYVDLNTISDEEYGYLSRISEFLDDPYLFQVYVVKDHDDIKSVFSLKYGYNYNNYTDLELCFATKEKDRNKGYCSFGFYMILEIIKTNPSIEEMFLISVNEFTDRICNNMHLPLKELYQNLYYFRNPNFNPKYKELEDMVEKEASLEELIEFCDDDGIMIHILNSWLNKGKNNQKLVYR